jgi:hypothetical protein
MADSLRPPFQTGYPPPPPDLPPSPPATARVCLANVDTNSTSSPSMHDGIQPQGSSEQGTRKRASQEAVPEAGSTARENKVVSSLSRGPILNSEVRSLSFFWQFIVATFRLWHDAWQATEIKYPAVLYCLSNYNVQVACFALRVWVLGFWFCFAFRCVALLCAMYVRLHLVLFPAGGPFLPSLSVKLYCSGARPEVEPGTQSC